MNKDQYEYNGFQYIKDYDKSAELNVDIIHSKAKPENLYKYFGLTENNVDALTGGIYMHLIHFN